MTILYFDCFAGISGDMVLGAFIDLGIDILFLQEELKKLNLSGFSVQSEKSSKKGISGTQCHVLLTEVNQPHRYFSDIKKIIMTSSLADDVKQTSISIFKRIALAEAKVHNLPIEQVHFHEVGALDSIVDIVGAAICYHHLKPDRVYASKINVGSGWVNCDHGLLPVPAPATAEILCQSSFSIYAKGIEGEATTPTGAAIISELATYSATMPTLIPEKTGYGFGSKDFDIPNALRIIRGGQEDPQEIMVLETNMDDMTGEMAGFVLERLMAEGALDAFYTPVYMKKNRPGIKLTVLSNQKSLTTLEDLILRETSTIGIRKYPVSRTCMNRHFRTVKTPYGDISIKVAEHGDIHKESLEYEDLKKAAQSSGKSLNEIIELVNQLK